MKSKTNKRNNNKSKTIELAARSYYIPKIVIAPAYRFTVRVRFTFNAGSVGPFNVSPTVSTLNSLVTDQLTSSSIKEINVALVGGNIPITTVNNPIFSFVRVKSVELWSTSAGSCDLSHVSTATTAAITIPATQKVNNQSTGSSNRAYSLLKFPNSKGHAYNGSAANPIFIAVFSGNSGSLQDADVFLDVSMVLFD